jgi:hypothetical protein
VLDAEGAVGRLGGARVEGGTAAGAVAEATTGGGGGVFGPETEAAFDAEGGYEIWVDGGWEPLKLREIRQASGQRTGARSKGRRVINGWMDGWM